MFLVERKTVTQNLIKTRSKFGDIVRVLKETEPNQTQTVSMKKFATSKRLRFQYTINRFLRQYFESKLRIKIKSLGLIQCN